VKPPAIVSDGPLARVIVMSTLPGACGGVRTAIDVGGLSPTSWASTPPKRTPVTSKGSVAPDTTTSVHPDAGPCAGETARPGTVVVGVTGALDGGVAPVVVVVTGAAPAWGVTRTWSVRALSPPVVYAETAKP
jgi:hypothetical protein